MEPPGPHLCRRRRPPASELLQLNGAAAGPLRLAGLAAATTLAVTSTGEVVLLGLLVGVAGAELPAALVGAVALAAVAVRWGSTSLDAIAGAQAVLGPGAVVGPAAAAAASWAAAAALVLAAPRGRPAVAFGAAAVVGLAGPAPGDPGDVALRVAATVAVVAAAAAAGRRLPRRSALLAGTGLGAAAFALALLS